MLTVNGCRTDENRRLAELAERQLERQSEQNRRLADMQHEVAEGSRRLVEADARARQDMVDLHRDLQTERSTVGQQRDALEEDRRNLAAQRHRDPIIAETIAQLGLLAASLLPLVVCWLLLRQPVEPADDREVAELLIADLAASEPVLLPKSPSPLFDDRRSPALPEPPDEDDPPP
jgi:hypothetical protein